MIRMGMGQDHYVQPGYFFIPEKRSDHPFPQIKFGIERTSSVYEHLLALGKFYQS